MSSITENKETIIRSFTGMQDSIAEVRETVLPNKEYERGVEYKLGDSIKVRNTHGTWSIGRAFADFTAVGIKEDISNGNLQVQPFVVDSGMDMQTLSSEKAASEDLSFDPGVFSATDTVNVIMSLTSPIEERLSNLETTINGVDEALDTLLNSI